MWGRYVRGILDNNICSQNFAWGNDDPGSICAKSFRGRKRGLLECHPTVMWGDPAPITFQAELPSLGRPGVWCRRVLWTVCVCTPDGLPQSENFIPHLYHPHSQISFFSADPFLQVYTQLPGDLSSCVSQSLLETELLLVLSFQLALRSSHAVVATLSSSWQGQCLPGGSWPPSLCHQSHAAHQKILSILPPK